MNRKILGNTNTSLPEVGLGTWNYIGGVEPRRRGVALGACLIDKAESYGTEEVVGEAVKGTRQSLFLATNVSATHFRFQVLLCAADQSLIDLYQPNDLFRLLISHSRSR
jgi:diketogulonate reductase-like aldo/keto reductase